MLDLLEEIVIPHQKGQGAEEEWRSKNIPLRFQAPELMIEELGQ